MIHPKRDAFGKCFPLVDVSQNALLALRIEFRNAVCFDVLLALGTYLLFHFKLHGQSVRVPPRFAAHMVSAHGAIAQNSVLKRAAFEVMNAGMTVGRWRTFVEYEFPSRRAFFEGFLENIALVPKIEYPLLALGHLTLLWFV